MRFLSFSNRLASTGTYIAGCVCLWLAISSSSLTVPVKSGLFNALLVIVGGGIAGTIALWVEFHSFERYGLWPKTPKWFITRIMLLSIVWVSLGVSIAIMLGMIFSAITEGGNFSLLIANLLLTLTSSFVLLLIPSSIIGPITGAINGWILLRAMRSAGY